MAIWVEVANAPGPCLKYALEDNATVGDALKTAGITSTEGKTVTRDEEEVEETDEVNDGDTLLVAARKVKGA